MNAPYLTQHRRDISLSHESSRRVLWLFLHVASMIVLSMCDPSNRPTPCEKTDALICEARLFTWYAQTRSLARSATAPNLHIRQLTSLEWYVREGEREVDSTQRIFLTIKNLTRLNLSRCTYHNSLSN
uniref:Uncharacterized protein n=1 Tax=Schistocephalus solidus TaxID=70667 RepID=A0A0X3PAN3_SCHSO